MIRCTVKLKPCDLWVGAYWDAAAKALYICPIPCVAFKIWKVPRQTLEVKVKAAMDALARLGYSREPDDATIKALGEMAEYAESLARFRDARRQGFDCK